LHVFQHCSGILKTLRRWRCTHFISAKRPSSISQQVCKNGGRFEFYRDGQSEAIFGVPNAYREASDLTHLHNMAVLLDRLDQPIYYSLVVERFADQGLARYHALEQGRLVLLDARKSSLPLPDLMLLANRRHRFAFEALEHDHGFRLGVPFPDLHG